MTTAVFLSTAGAATVFLLVMHFFVVVFEEPALTRRFGAAYRSYRFSVHRWRIRKPRMGERP
jgi:protein-S-isoprenylcysteine O-methyltransferase Ste14